MRPTITVAGTLLASLTLLAGCSPDKPPTPTTTGAPVSPPTDTPAADPPVDVAFPDLSSSSYAESIDRFAVGGALGARLFVLHGRWPHLRQQCLPRAAVRIRELSRPDPCAGPGDWAVTAEAGKTATIESIIGDPGRPADRQSSAVAADAQGDGDGEGHRAAGSTTKAPSPAGSARTASCSRRRRSSCST